MASILDCLIHFMNMKINPEKLKKLGSGTEKRVYEDPNNPDRALGIYHESQTESAERVKGRFYLTKILHLLLPKNVPDMHLAASDPHAIVVDKVRGWNAVDYVDYDENKFSSAFKELRSKLESVGIDWIDGYSENFIFDKDGNLFFVDSFQPWSEESCKSWFDKEKLELALQNLEDKKRDEGLSYLKRLEELNKKDWENAQNRDRADVIRSKK